MQLKTITELLNLPNFQVDSELEQTEKSIHLYVDLIEPAAPVCSAFSTFHHPPVHSVGGMGVEDLPLCGKRVYLYVPKRKVLCLKDGKIRVAQFSWLRGRFTLRFLHDVVRNPINS